MTTPAIDQIRYLKSNFYKLRDLGLLLLELGAEVAPFVREAVQVASPFFAFLMEDIPAGVVLIGGRVSQFDIPGFDLIFELGNVFFRCGNLFF